MFHLRPTHYHYFVHDKSTTRSVLAITRKDDEHSHSRDDPTGYHLTATGTRSGGNSTNGNGTTLVIDERHTTINSTTSPSISSQSAAEPFTFDDNMMTFDRIIAQSQNGYDSSVNQTTATATTPSNTTESSPSLVMIQGYVLAKRQLSKHLVFVDLLCYHQDQRKLSNDNVDDDDGNNLNGNKDHNRRTSEQQPQHRSMSFPSSQNPSRLDGGWDISQSRASSSPHHLNTQSTATNGTSIFQAILKRDDYGTLETLDDDSFTSSQLLSSAELLPASEGLKNDDNDDPQQQQQLHPPNHLAETKYFDTIRKGFLHKGTKLTLWGYAKPTNNPGNVVLSIRSVSLVSLPRNVQHIESLLQHVIKAATTTTTASTTATTTTTTPTTTKPLSTSDSEGTAVSITEGDQIVEFPTRSTATSSMTSSFILNHVISACHLEESSINQIKEDMIKSNLLRYPPSTNEGLRAKSKSTTRKLRDIAMQIFQQLRPDPLYPYNLVDTSSSSSRDKNNLNGNRELSSSSKLFMIPTAPVEWRKIPSSILRLKFDETNAGGGSNDVVSDKGVQNEFVQTPKDRVFSVSEISSMDGNLNANFKNHTSSQDLSPSQTRIVLEGIVQNRRRYADDITVLVLVDHSEANETQPRMECVLHPDLVVNWDHAQLFRNLAAVGAKVRVTARIHSTTTNRRFSLWIKTIRLLQSAHHPSTIEYLLRNVVLSDNEGSSKQGISIQEAADALKLTQDEACGLRKELKSCSQTELRWKANKLSVRLQQVRSGLNPNPDSRLTDDQRLVLDQYKTIVEKYPIEASQDLSLDLHLSRTLKQPLNRIRMPGSRWETRKLPQIFWMTRTIEDLLKAHPEYGQRKLRILDVGGGKGLLAHHLVRTLDNIHVHVVDICEGATRNGMKKANRSGRMVGYRTEIPESLQPNSKSTVFFQWADASKPDELSDLNVDLVCALHPCGHLTDVALYHAISRHADFVIVPCCFNSNQHLTIPSKKIQYAHEWHGIPEWDWSIIKSISEIQGDTEVSRQGMHAAIAVRAETAKRAGRFDVRISSFPIEFSTRNLVVVGTTH